MIVEFGGPLVMRIVYQVAHMVGGFKDIEVEAESLLKLLQALLLEARETGVVHELNQVAELHIVLSNGQVCLHGFCYK